jgi:hypothetical protein
MNANKKLKMMSTNEQSFPASSADGETKTAANDSNTVTPESNAWATMLLWKTELLINVKLSDEFVELVPPYLVSSGVKTVQDLNEKAKNSAWMYDLSACGVKLSVLQGKLGQVKFAKADTRMVPVNYGIADSLLSHTADLDALRQRVEETFDWYIEDPRTSVAPYFPFIQSSGMGKTKLLYELRRMMNKEEDTRCRLCLCGPIDVERDDWKPSDTTEVFSDELDFRNVVAEGNGNSEDTKRTMEVQARYAAKSVMQSLDNFFSSCMEKRLVLLFDESQVLLAKNFGIDAFLFQCIRVWIRQTPRKFNCVAVFAGTTSNLANFFPDESLVSTFSSRDVDVEDNVRNFLPGGKQLPLPFYQTTTIGCCLIFNSAQESVPAAKSEYEKAVPYGRPLFSKMAENTLLERRLGKVLSRMLLSYVEEWESNQESCLSILATRVQMGQTSTDVASRLVSRGYASLVGFSDCKVAQICYHPDPVCARLAMALMDEDWKIYAKGCVVSGRSKHWWVERAAATFSSGLCRPDKGNAGEVFAALYLLFCGDLLRKEVASETFTLCGTAGSPTEPAELPKQLDIPSYRHFSIPLGRWIANLIYPSTQPTKESTVLDSVPSTRNQASPSVSFIQVYRNSLRQYKDYEYVCSQSLLEYLYKSGTAFYSFLDCPHFDIVASIRYIHKDIFLYAPLLISVKACKAFYPKKADVNCQEMENGLSEAKNCHRALCLVLVMFSTVDTNYGARTLKEDDIGDLFAAGDKKRVAAKVLQIGIHDAFGMSERVIAATSAGQEMSELLQSHHSVRAHAKDSSNYRLTHKSAMRGGSGKRVGAVFLKTLVEQLKGMTMSKDKS